MTNTVRSDTLDRVAPLGVRFWDPVEHVFVTDGLVVRVRLAGSRESRAAKANASGIFTVQNLPRLGAAEVGLGDAAYWAKVATLSFVVEVHDSHGQFMPFSFPAQLPARGLFVWTCALASPPVSGWLADGAPLFSAPARAIAPMRAVIRAQMQDAVSGQFAAGAVLGATVGAGEMVRGVADAQGRVAIVLPYPEPLDFPLVGDGSPPPYAPVGGPFSSYTWPVVLAAQYTPATVLPKYPDLCTTLSQPTAQLWGTRSARLSPRRR